MLQKNNGQTPQSDCPNSAKPGSVKNVSNQICHKLCIVQLSLDSLAQCLVGSVNRDYILQKNDGQAL